MKWVSHKMVVFTILTMALLQPFSGRSSTIRDDVPDSSYVDLANSPAYAAVGVLVNSWGYTGCGTLISPSWVLTAAHMLDAATSGTFTINGTAYTSDEIIKDPGWTGNSFGGNDFGLVHLSTPVTSVTPVTLFTGASAANQVATYVGYGFTGTGLTGWKTLDGQKRAFQNVVDGDFGAPGLLLGSDFDNPNTAANNWWGDATPLPLEGCVAPGDSGGGVFVTIDSQTYLAGVISFVAATDGNSNSNYGDLSGFGPISVAMPWILSTAPEPSMNLLLAGTGLALFLMRCRRSNRISA
jgi:hypothetical protein